MKKQNLEVLYIYNITKKTTLHKVRLSKREENKNWYT